MDMMIRNHKQLLKKERKERFVRNLNSHLPVFILSDNLRSFFSWGVKAHTNGNYSHIMVMVHPDKVATQGWLYKEIDIKKYLRDDIRLKVWYYKDMPKDIADSLKVAVEADLSRSMWVRMYDWLGVIGQLLGKKFRWLNIPYKDYCSERTAKYIKIVFPDYKSNHPSPTEENEFFGSKKEMKVLCRWNAD